MKRSSMAIRVVTLVLASLTFAPSPLQTHIPTLAGSPTTRYEEALVSDPTRSGEYLAKVDHSAPQRSSTPPPLAALADVDPDNDGEVAPPAPIADCEARLKAASIDFKAAKLPIRRRRGGPICGAEQAVVYRSSPLEIRYSSAPLVTCGMALAIADFEAIVSEEAARHLGKRVVSVAHAGTYSCRQMARFQALVSEHSYANAIDIRSFRLENGRTVSVLRDFSKVDTAAGQFLHAVARRAYDENVFSVVLTEYFDKLHRDHFHLDLARYRVDGTR